MLIGVGTFTLFLPVVWFQFINYDDPGYVVENEHVISGCSLKNLIWAVSTLHAGLSYWHPVTWLTHQLDCQCFGLNAGAHHLTSVLFHSLAGVLLFRFLSRYTGQLGCSALVSALFCLHPLHVESVAWISERKDVLSGFFWMATLNAYGRYAEKPVFRRYFLTVLLFGFALMSKPSAVALPLTLFLLDFWPLRRCVVSNAVDRSARRATIMRLLIEKVPLIFMAGAASVAAFEAQRQLGAMTSISAFGWSERIDNALISYGLYIIKAFWPSNLAPLYVHIGSWPFEFVIACGAMILCCTWVTISLRHSRSYLVVGWLWFLGTLVPMIGLIQVGAQSMADRYSYISLVGLFIMVAWGTGEVATRLSVPPRALLAFASVAVLLATATTEKQLLYWSDSLSLFEHTVQVDRGNLLARQIYALALAGDHRFREADIELGQALQIFPSSILIKKTRANLYLAMGNVREAVEVLKEVVRTDPADVDANRQLAWIYATCADDGYRDAKLALRHALVVFARRTLPDADKLDTLAVALAAKGDFDAACRAEKDACSVALEAGKTDEQFVNRLNLFRAKRPYRQEFGVFKLQNHNSQRRLPSHHPTEIRP